MVVYMNPLGCKTCTERNVEVELANWSVKFEFKTWLSAVAAIVYRSRDVHTCAIHNMPSILHYGNSCQAAYNMKETSNNSANKLLLGSTCPTSIYFGPKVPI